MRPVIASSSSSTATPAAFEPTNSPSHSNLSKIYYCSNPISASPNNTYINNVSRATVQKNKLAHTNNILQYYYNDLLKSNTQKQSNLCVVNNRRILDKYMGGNADTSKAPFSSTKRPLSMRLSTPKHVVNFFNRTLFRSDSQKRPLLLNNHHLNNDGCCGDLQTEFDINKPNFQIIAGKNGLRISSIYTITENVEKFSLKNTLYRKRNLYNSSNSRPLFVRK